jgi:hypothetical protein
VPPVPAPGVDVDVLVFPPLPNALPPAPNKLPVGAEAVPAPPGVFPAPAPPNAEPLVVFKPRLPKALVPAAGVEPGVAVPWFLF